MLPAAGHGQQGPIRLFPPELAPTLPEGAEPRPGEAIGPAPAAPGTEPAPSREQTAPRGFQVEGLAPPEVDSIGIGVAEGGFERNLWAGSDPELIQNLVGALPVATRNPPLWALTRRVLATGATIEGADTGGRMLSARVERLLAMGDLDSAKRLLDQLPPSSGDTPLARLAAETALLLGEDAAACQRAADLAPTGGAAFWAEVAIYCRLAAGDVDGARLGLDLLRESGQGGDASFFQLAGTVADGAGGAPPRITEPTAVEVALLRLAGQPLPAAALAEASPAVLSAAVRDPVLTGERQLEIAEQAFAAGALAPEGLAAAYRAAAEGDASPAVVLESLRTAWGPQTRALAWRAADAAPTPQERGALLDATWRAASGEERFLLAAAFGRQFANLTPDRALLATAPSAARALLASERPLPAARWFALLSDEVGRNSAAAREVALLQPLFALAGIGGSTAVPDLDRQAVAAWRRAMPEADARAERLFAMLDGVGAPVPDEAWWQELALPLQRPASVPVSAAWRTLERAAADGRLGETVVFALHMLDGAPEVVHPEVLTRSLQALREVGLDREARATAVATAIAMDL